MWLKMRDRWKGDKHNLNLDIFGRLKENTVVTLLKLLLFPSKKKFLKKVTTFPFAHCILFPKSSNTERDISDIMNKCFHFFGAYR